MGVINITPDSFSDGGKYYSETALTEKAVADAIQMEKDGADFIDIGGESTRPGAETVSLNEELNRVIPAISELSKKIRIPISIDTYKSQVAEEALKNGAEIVNDISGFKFDNKMTDITAKHNASCILMHIKGTPKDMQKNPEYENVIKEVYDYLNDSINIAKNAGVKQIITDVGIGFGKSLEHNTVLLKNLNYFQKLGHPILLGVSRKSFMNKIFPVEMNERLEGTITANTIGIMNGANILRVHDIKENLRAVKIADYIKYKTA
ncbi:MAG TPA: dihydropteroate synthase [Ignavibacteria bacterium]|nr:dihydropteroate synthase [Ignavibacteria bacterium]